MSMLDPRPRREGEEDEEDDDCSYVNEILEAYRREESNAESSSPQNNPNSQSDSLPDMMEEEEKDNCAHASMDIKNIRSAMFEEPPMKKQKTEDPFQSDDEDSLSPVKTDPNEQDIDAKNTFLLREKDPERFKDLLKDGNVPVEYADPGLTQSQGKWIVNNAGILMTERKRQILRKFQRSLLRRLNEGEFQGSGRATWINNHYYQAVADRSEMKLDANNHMTAVEKIVSDNMRKIKVPRYDVRRFVDKLAGKLQSKDGLDWSQLGEAVRICFDSVPSGVNFMNGVVSSDDITVVRQRRRRLNLDDYQNEPAVKPQLQERYYESQQEKEAAEKASRRKTPKMVLAIKKKLISTTDRSHTGEVDGLGLLFDPGSFTKTVENVFHFSFLVKAGEAGIAQNEAQLRAVSHHLDPESTQQGEPKQAIIGLSMKDWRRLLKRNSSDPQRSDDG